jgi:steroid 17alpha-monooxygenase/17alpha-hydroxyprogesterone aldolase/cytochrome P450 family 1 subfamily A polypeptide 1
VVFDRYGPVITVYLGPMRCVTLNRLDVIQEALVTKGADFAGRPQLYSLSLMTDGFKNIIFAHDSAAWRLHRKIAMHALRLFMKGQRLEVAVHEVVTMTVERLLVEKEPIDPMRYMVTLMFHVISSICFGECRSWDDPSFTELINIFDMFTSEFGNGFWEDVIPPLRKFPTRKFRRFTSILPVFDNYVIDHIGEHRKTFDPENIREIVDSVLAAQREAEKEESAEVMAMFTDAHVRQTISDIFGGGFDTSRIMLYWSLLFMAGLPEVKSFLHFSLFFFPSLFWVSGVTCVVTYIIIVKLDPVETVGLRWTSEIQFLRNEVTDIVFAEL